jgi:peptidyl-prolyl cis-trans isomerase C
MVMRGKSIVEKALGGLAILALCVGNVGAQENKTPKSPVPNTKPAAVVNGVTISLGDVEALIKARGPLPGEATETQRKQLKQLALDKLIDDLLLQQFLQKNAPRMAQEELAKRLSEMESALKKEGKTLADLSKETGQTEEQLRRNAVNGLLLEGFIKGKVKEPDLKRFYTDNKDFFDGAAVKASHIVLRVKPNAPESERQAAHDKLLRIRQEIVAKKITFADAAKKYSESETASRGGDLGFFPRKGAVEEPFAKAAYSLEPNQISNVVATDFGMHLIVVTDKKAGQPSDYDKIKDSVRESYIEEMIQNLLAEKRKESKIVISNDL